MNILLFVFLWIAILIFTSLSIIKTSKDYLITNREQNVYKAFMSQESYPNFYAKFGKFPIEYLNKSYIDEKNKEGKIMDLSLKDFYIASAYRPYQVAGQTYDICSYKMIKTIIQKGARFHYIDIWSSNPHNQYDETAYPIVRNKTIMPGKTGQALLFDKVCQIYKKYSWLGTKYPLILYLNLEHTSQKNIFIQQKIAKSLWKHFKGKFVGAKYSFGKNNIGNIPIKKAMNNIIILTNIYPKQGHLQEITNGVISKNIQNSGRLDIYDEGNVLFGGIQVISPDMKSVVEYNKLNLGIVIPGDLKNLSNIYNPGSDLIQIPIHIDKTIKVCNRNSDKDSFGFKKKSPFNYGFNFICINYQKPGKERQEYIDFFKESSLVLKCKKFRHIPGPKPIINKQNINASYSPRNMDFMKGYFTHKF